MCPLFFSLAAKYLRENRRNHKENSFSFFCLIYLLKVAVYKHFTSWNLVVIFYSFLNIHSRQESIKYIVFFLIST